MIIFWFILINKSKWNKRSTHQVYIMRKSTVRQILLYNAFLKKSEKIPNLYRKNLENTILLLYTDPYCKQIFNITRANVCIIWRQLYFHNSLFQSLIEAQSKQNLTDKSIYPHLTAKIQLTFEFSIKMVINAIFYGMTHISKY